MAGLCSSGHLTTTMAVHTLQRRTLGCGWAEIWGQGCRLKKRKQVQKERSPQGTRGTCSGRPRAPPSLGEAWAPGLATGHSCLHALSPSCTQPLRPQQAWSQPGPEDPWGAKEQRPECCLLPSLAVLESPLCRSQASEHRQPLPHPGQEGSAPPGPGDSSGLPLLPATLTSLEPWRQLPGPSLAEPSTRVPSVARVRIAPSSNHPFPLGPAARQGPGRGLSGCQQRKPGLRGHG